MTLATKCGPPRRVAFPPTSRLIARAWQIGSLWLVAYSALSAHQQPGSALQDHPSHTRGPTAGATGGTLVGRKHRLWDARGRNGLGFLRSRLLIKSAATPELAIPELPPSPHQGWHPSKIRHLFRELLSTADHAGLKLFHDNGR